MKQTCRRKTTKRTGRRKQMTRKNKQRKNRRNTNRRRVNSRRVNSRRKQRGGKPMCGQNPCGSKPKTKTRAQNPASAPTGPTLFPKPSPIDPGQLHNKPKHPRTAVFIISKDPDTNQWYVILSRKAMGPNQSHISEKEQVGYLDYLESIDRKRPYNLGASGTKPRFWGKWGSFGGTNSEDATSNLEAGILEVQEEAAVDSDVTAQLEFLNSYETRDTMVYTAYLPWSSLQTMKYLDKRQDNESRLALLISSKGEIAEIRKVPVDDVLPPSSALTNKVASYAAYSYKHHVLPFINTLRS